MSLLCPLPQLRATQLSSGTCVADSSEAERLLQGASDSYDAGQVAMASLSARQALALFESLRDVAGQIRALRLIIRANLHADSDRAVAAAERGVTLCQWQEDMRGEASMWVAAACAHLSRIETALGRRKVYLSGSAASAVESAKTAYSIYGELGDEFGMREALGLISGLASQVGMGDFLSLQSGEGAFAQMETKTCQEELAMKHESKLKQLEWQSYPQRDSGCGLWWTFTWDPYIPAGATTQARKAHTSVTAVAPRSLAAPMYHTLTDVQSEPATYDKKRAMGVHFISTLHASHTYAACLMGIAQVISGMATARVGRLSLVQLGEGNPDPFNPTFEVGNLTFHPVALAMLRCARVDCPQTLVTLVSGDAASWMAERRKMVEAIFDSTEMAEVEQMYTRGECYIQTMIPMARSEQPGSERADRKMEPLIRRREDLERPLGPCPRPQASSILSAPRMRGVLQPPSMVIADRLHKMSQT